MGVRMAGVGVVVVVALSGLAEGLYFHIGETERKCFIEETPDETMVTGNYKLQLYDPRTSGFMPSAPGLGMHVEIRDPDDRVLLSRAYSSEGRFTFTSHTPGEHVICLHSNSTKWFSGSRLRVHFDIQVGERTVNYASMAHKEKLTKLQLRVRQLLNQVEHITKEQNYQRYREERFRQTHESTCQQMLWWSVGQVAILLGMSFWQRRHLKSYSHIASQTRYYPMGPKTQYPTGAGIGSQVFLNWALENYWNDHGSPVGSVPPPKGSVK